MKGILSNRIFISNRVVLSIFTTKLNSGTLVNFQNNPISLLSQVFITESAAKQSLSLDRPSTTILRISLDIRDHDTSVGDTDNDNGAHAGHGHGDKPRRRFFKSTTRAEVEALSAFASTAHVISSSLRGSSREVSECLLESTIALNRAELGDFSGGTTEGRAVPSNYRDFSHCALRPMMMFYSILSPSRCFRPD